jgi:Transposase DDE domain
MGRQARAGHCLELLVKMAIPMLQAAERQCPRKGRGDKPKIPEWVMAALIMIVVLKKKKTKSAQYRFLVEQRRQIAAWLPGERFPARATYFRRYRRAHQLYRQAIRLQGDKAIAEGVSDPRQVAVDKSLISGHGPPWHKQDRQAGKIPAGVDCECAWGYSKHDGWVHGYSYEVVVSATANATVFPLLASVNTASASETKSCPDKIDDLPEATEAVLADSGYDANALAERVEYDEEDRRTGRRFVCPQNPRNNQRPKTKRGGADASRARTRERRRQRQQFFQSRRGRRWYARRKKTVEPFNQWFKSLFELEGRVWHRGLDNNRTHMLAALFVYQLLVRYNFACGHNNGQVRWLMDGL